MAKFRLDNKTAVVTGGGSGIGRSIALNFAQSGAFVYILDINLKNAEATAKKIVEEGGQASAHICDVTNQPETVELFAKIEAARPIDILVNNAGIGLVGKLHETKEEDFDRLYRVNIKGIYNCLYAAVPYMKERSKGVILNMSSIVAGIGIPERFAYSMTKGAVLTMTLSVALDYINDGIRCNCIAPARIHTPFVDDYLAKNYPGKEQEMFNLLSKTQPIGRMGTPEEVADLALFLCSDEAGFITGAQYLIDGGFTNLIP
jgi:NAD(P)-dependent dehydrogenase (short-subunit alcohol dehydrogenase family)